MNTMLISDVFGITPALLKLKHELGANVIVDPYKGESMGFNNEAEAYSHFITTVGIDSYVTELLNVIKSLECQTRLIGFSVGASAIWKLSLNNENNHIKEAFCFYGSQIRNLTQIEPSFNINLVFPKSEEHFDVSALIATLTGKKNVKITQVEYLHGFMNYCSRNFSPVGYKKSINLLQAMAR